MARLLIAVAVLEVTLSVVSYPIFNFIINDSHGGVLLEFSRFPNASFYEKSHNSTVTVVVLSNKADAHYAELHRAGKLIKSEADFVFEPREFKRLRTPQVHVIVRPSSSLLMPGIIKFMAPLKKMNAKKLAHFVDESVAIERAIISPNIHKVLCVPSQQVVLMNTVVGSYRAFTMYVGDMLPNYGEDLKGSSGFDLKEVEKVLIANGTDVGESVDEKLLDPLAQFDFSDDVATALLNPLACDKMFGANLMTSVIGAKF